jgi:carboxypeptidase C (cathepsin A)
MKRLSTLVISSMLCISMWGFSAEMADDSAKSSCSSKQSDSGDAIKETSHVLSLKEGSIPYKASVGSLTIKDGKEDPKAHIFYVAYTKTDVANLAERPVTFCFNGGPGSSSIWLHMGAFGPKRVVCDAKGMPVIPFKMVDNIYSLLDVTDLVFIDPVATGYSKPAHGQEAKQFFGVQEDIESVAEFIRTYVTKYGRWQSPKLLAGESYGTTRAAGLASFLQNSCFMSIDGVILISSVLNWQTIDLGNSYSGNDLPCILALPSYAAAARYHKKIESTAKINDFLKEVEDFAIGPYASALMKGDKIAQDEREKLIEKLSGYTGLSKEIIDCLNMRLDVMTFTKQLLSSKKTLVGRFDARACGIDLAPCDSQPSYDPSIERLALAYTSLFNSYLKQDLQWSSESEYKILSDVFPWNFQPAVNQFLNLAPSLRAVMTKTMNTKVFVASGIYDLATPYFATEYTIDHMQLSPELTNSIISHFYPGGHMMYVNETNLQKLKNDLAEFFSSLNISVKK